MKKIIHGGILLSGAIILTLFFSCSFTDSENVKTSGIWASFTVEHESDTRIEARAILRVGGPLGTNLEMSSGERITCNGVEMSWALLYYYTVFDTPASGDTYTFRFERVDETVTTVVTVPASPSLVSTDPADNYNEWDPLIVNWDETESESGDLIDIYITGTNITTYTANGLEDDGSYTVNNPKGTGITSIDNAAASAISVSVRRYRTGEVNEDYQGGGTRGEHWAPAVTIDNFQPKLTLGITISPENSGTVTSDGDISGPTDSGQYRKYEMGELVDLTAIPATGWAFYNWSGDITSEANPYNDLEITANMSITANFGAPE